MYLTTLERIKKITIRALRVISETQEKIQQDKVAHDKLRLCLGFVSFIIKAQDNSVGNHKELWEYMVDGLFSYQVVENDLFQRFLKNKIT